MTCRVYSMGLASVVTVAVAASPLPAPPEGPAPIIETEPVDRDFVPWWNGPGMDGEELYWEHEWAGDIRHAMPRSGSGGTHRGPNIMMRHDAATGITTPVGRSGPLRGRSGVAGTSFTGVDGSINWEEDRGFGTMGFATGVSLYPTRVNCRILAQFTGTNPAGTSGSFTFQGSGTFIDAETVLTAGHVIYMNTWTDNAGTLWTFNAFPDWCVVRAATHLGTDNWGRADGTAYWAGTGWMNNANLDADVGLIAVDRAAGMLTGWHALAFGGNCEWVEDQTFFNFSYPGENCDDGGPLHNGLDMYFWNGDFDSCPNNQLQIDTTAGCTTSVWGGQSGSGAYYLDDSGTRRVLGVCSTSDRATWGRWVHMWEGMSDYIVDTVIPAARGNTMDLQAMWMRQPVGSPIAYAAGDSIPTTLVRLANATNGVGSGGWLTRVYLSTNQDISVNDTLVSSAFYEWDVPAMTYGDLEVNNIAIPVNTPSGTYFLGHVLDAGTDTVPDNNDTDNWDCMEITVVASADPAAVDAMPLDSVAYAGETLDVQLDFANNGAANAFDPVLVVRASTDQNITDADTLLANIFIGTLSGAGNWSLTPTVNIPGNLPAGDFFIGLSIESSTTDADPSNNVVASSTTFTVAHRPYNDDCENAIWLPDGTFSFDTTGASTDGETHPSCAQDGTTHNDVWYQYIVPHDGQLTVTTCEELGGSADFDTDIVLYLGDYCDSMQLIACNENDQDHPCGEAPDYHSTATAIVQEGQSIHIRVGAFSPSGSGTGQLVVHTRPVNDNCEDALPIVNGDDAFSTVGATTDGISHAECDDDGQTYHDIWYAYQSPCSGTLTVSTCDQADYDTDLVIYEGSCSDDAILACNDDFFECAGFTSLVEAPVIAGNVYLVRVGGWWDGDMGSGVLTLSCDSGVDGDVNNDNIVDLDDLLLIIAAWETDGDNGTDLNGDGIVNIHDLLIVVANWD